MTDEEEEHWVIDASMSDPPLFCFCPVEERDGETHVMVGLSFISTQSPGPLEGIYHPDGEGAAIAWTEEHKEAIEEAVPSGQED